MLQGGSWWQPWGGGREHYPEGNLMQVQRLIDDFADIGIKLTAENGQVVFEGPREMLTP